MSMKMRWLTCYDLPSHWITIICYEWFWMHVLNSTLQHHISYKNDVPSTCSTRLAETCRISAKSNWFCSTLVTHREQRSRFLLKQTLLHIQNIFAVAEQSIEKKNEVSKKVEHRNTSIILFKFSGFDDTSQDMFSQFYLLTFNFLPKWKLVI